ncbi:putative hydrolase of the HAD superfamily [Modicisalibacter muralis]|uniref:Putative hydrolase of the HAD superfamily n=1 Tax=Modicisalibacter muralis TaxID=119000 RepID=A0A1G9NLE5_9GAMM|nr:HAD family hydrolase [Halomonas muralis]SDL87209.1 putative hydrolase of the HAD superfamily [Halomonas muralis]
MSLQRLPIDALTFDLDDTLWDNRPVMEHAEQGHYTWLDDALASELDASIVEQLRDDLGRYGERFPLDAYVERRLAMARRHPLRRGDFTWLRERALVELLEEFGLPRSAAFLWAAAAIERFLALRHELTPYAEVVDLLEALCPRYALAAITNGNADLERLELASHFPVVIAAGELLAPKPDARPFLAALARLGSTPARAMHVGDSWQEDVLPALRLGMRVAWIDKHDERPSALPAGVYRLAHIRDLPALLDSLA